MPNRVKEPYAVEPRKLPSGRWKGRVVRYDHDTGKRLEINQTFDSKKEAKNWAEKEAVSYREDPNRKPPSEETLREYMERWLAIKRTLNLAEKTLSSYRQMAAHSIRELGDKPLKSLQPLQIQLFYGELTTRQLSARTIRYVHTVLKMALDDAVEWGVIAVNPARKVKVSEATPTKGLRIPSAGEMAKFVQANQDTRWHPLWAWFTVTGTRLGEALALRWIDIDWDNQEATIRQSLSGDAANRVIKSPKTLSGSRTIVLGPRMAEILRTHQKNQQDLRGLAGSEWEESGLVFTTFHGKLLSKRNVEREFKKALARAGLPLAIRIHDLRHGTATQWLAKGVNPKVVTKRLGHSDVAFTLQVYGHVLPGDEAPIAEKMEAEILSQGGDFVEANGPQTGRRNIPKPHDNTGQFTTTDM